MWWRRLHYVTSFSYKDNVPRRLHWPGYADLEALDWPIQHLPHPAAIYNKINLHQYMYNHLHGVAQCMHEANPSTALTYPLSIWNCVAHILYFCEYRNHYMNTFGHDCRLDCEHMHAGICMYYTVPSYVLYVNALICIYSLM